MREENSGSNDSNREISFQRKAKAVKLRQLGDYDSGYTVDNFLGDLVKYFDGEVDFNLDKIRKTVEQPQRLAELIAKAKRKNTHPVAEFVEELFKDLAS